MLICTNDRIRDYELRTLVEDLDCTADDLNRRVQRSRSFPNRAELEEAYQTVCRAADFLARLRDGV